jgi:hypothetical protein
MLVFHTVTNITNRENVAFGLNLGLKWALIWPAMISIFDRFSWTIWRELSTLRAHVKVGFSPVGKTILYVKKLALRNGVSPQDKFGRVFDLLSRRFDCYSVLPEGELRPGFFGTKFAEVVNRTQLRLRESEEYGACGYDG